MGSLTARCRINAANGVTARRCPDAGGCREAPPRPTTAASRCGRRHSPYSPARCLANVALAPLQRDYTRRAFSRRAFVRRGFTRRGFTRRGFTLLELMIALAVLAVVSVTVLGRGGETARQLGQLEEKTLARWLAEDQVAQLRLSRAGSEEKRSEGAERHQVRRGGRQWEVVTETRSTSHPLLQRVEVTVYALREGQLADPSDTLIAFAGRH